MLMASLLLWVTTQYGTPLRSCYALPNGKTICSCDTIATLYISGTETNQPGRIRSTELDLIEDSAEDLYEKALKNQWGRASSPLGILMKVGCRVLEGENSNLAELNTRMARLQTDVIVRDQNSTVEDANEITRIVIELETNPHLRVPLAVDMLDYYSRELEIGFLRRDVTLLQGTVRDLRRTWDEIRPAVAARGGHKVFARFDAIVSSLEHAKALPDYARLLRSEQGQAEKLENLFTKDIDD
jgi:hypothetical protein